MTQGEVPEQGLPQAQPGQGDPSFGGDVPQSEAPPQGYVPQRDLDQLRSTKDRELARIRSEYDRQLQELRTQQQQAQLQSSVMTRAAELEQQYIQHYLQQGVSQQDAVGYARYYAQQHAQQEVTQQHAQSTQQQELERLRGQIQQQERRQSLIQLRDRVMARSGLSEAELEEATGHLDPSSPTFQADVMEAAFDYATSRGQGQPQGQPQDARTLQQTVPFFAGSTAPGSATPLPPPGAEIGTPAMRKWIEERAKEQRRRR